MLLNPLAGELLPDFQLLVGEFEFLTVADCAGNQHAVSPYNHGMGELDDMPDARPATVVMAPLDLDGSKEFVRQRCLEQERRGGVRLLGHHDGPVAAPPRG